MRKVLIVIMIFGSCFVAAAQCKSYAKKMLPELSPFVHNGHLNVKKFSDNETMETNITFYSGQFYRLLIGAEMVIGSIEVRMEDEQGNVLYKETGLGTIIKDFKVETTTNLKVKVTRTKNNTASIPGCVSILVGFKLQSPKGRGGF